MLIFISIDNFALIDHLEVEFQEGLNLITGETGSGKSILVDALGLLLGGRANQEMIRQGFDSARVEGIFHTEGASGLRLQLENAGLEPDPEQIIIRREISRSGSNKVFVNGTLTTQGFLLELGHQLADIHGQHQQQLLLQPSNHIHFLDGYGGLFTLRGEVASSYAELHRVRTTLKEAKASEQQRLQRLDLLQFQSAEIEKLALRPGLDRELEEERTLLSSAEKRAQFAQQSYRLLYEDDDSVLSLLDRTESLLEELAGLDPSMRDPVERLRESRFLIEETAYRLRDYFDQVEVDSQRLEALELRLAELHKARLKYGETVDDILQYFEEITEEILRLKANEKSVQKLVSDESRLAHECLQKAHHLSRLRSQAAIQLSGAVEKELKDLAMPDAVFKVEARSDRHNLSGTGIDTIEFLFSANPGEAPQALAKIASGGEISRLMLALKSLVIPEGFRRTMVFDEIDSGIGGRTATSLGEKLSRLSARHQVFCVTHLPQIAAFADRHFHVEKETREKRTVVRIRPLNDEEREQELARMMAGQKVSETTRRQAREMLREKAGHAHPKGEAPDQQ